MRIRSLIAGLTIAASAVLTTPAQASVPEFEANGDTCPSTVVLAARGSEQNQVFTPTRYSQQAPWISNGFEERTIGAMLSGAESYWLSKTGQSLLKDTLVLGLTPEHYPAVFPIGQQLGSIEYLKRSVETGRLGVMGAIEDFESSTGCTPNYLLVGYSQGSLVINNQDEELRARDQYVGTILLADPAQRSDDINVIGHQSELGGLTSFFAQPGESEGTIRYCLEGDIVCDLHPRQILAALENPDTIEMSADDMKVMQPHSHYFQVNHPADELVYEQIAEWIMQPQ